MGSIHSLQEKLKDMSEAADEAARPADSEVVTPIRPTMNKRLLDLDPRSPTENISRTPIVVDKTPMLPPLGNAGERRRVPTTPCGADDPIDPRSPTSEFTRTPINPCAASGTSKIKVKAVQTTPSSREETPERVIDPRSPTNDFSRTPIHPSHGSDHSNVRAIHMADIESPTSLFTQGSESGIESAEVTPIKGELHFRDIPDDLNLESPDSAFSVNAANPSEPTDSSSEAENTPNTSTTSTTSCSDVDDKTPLVRHQREQALAKESTPKIPVLRCKPLALTKLSKLVLESNSQVHDQEIVVRSPLSTVNNTRAGLGSNTKQRNLGTPMRQKINRSNNGGDANSGHLSVDKENCV